MIYNKRTVEFHPHYREEDFVYRYVVLLYTLHETSTIRNIGIN
ncbi:hypothetical protein [Scytonema hofmannii]|nr:hypothetical protein [Scytonema hofmannii]